MRQYSADRIELNFFGVDLKPGLASGTFVTEARNAPTWSQKVSGMGPVTRVYNPDRSATITMLIDQESAVHQQLRSLAELDRIARNVVGVLTLYDASSGETTYYKNAYITTEPDETRGNEAATFSWVFACEAVERKAVNLGNVVP